MLLICQACLLILALFARLFLSYLQCGDGLQTRNVTCQSYDGRMLDLSSCSGGVMPVTQRVCSLQPCPHWHRDTAWGACSQTCTPKSGVRGVRNRTVTCRMPHDNTTWFGAIQPNESLCPPVGSGDVGDGVGTAGVTAVSLSRQACVLSQRSMQT